MPCQALCGISCQVVSARIHICLFIIGLFIISGTSTANKCLPLPLPGNRRGCTRYGNPQIPLGAHPTGNGARNQQYLDLLTLLLGEVHAAACSVSGLQEEPWEEKAPSVPGIKIDVLWDFPAAPPSFLELLASIKNINKMVLVYSGCPLTTNPVKKGFAALYWAVRYIWRHCVKGK